MAERLALRVRAQRGEAEDRGDELAARALEPGRVRDPVGVERERVLALQTC